MTNHPSLAAHIPEIEAMPEDTPTVPINAARLIDPEDLLINSSINERGYNVRVAASRNIALMIEDWLEKFQNLSQNEIMVSLDYKRDTDKNKKYYGTYVYDFGDSIAVLYVSTQDTAFFHFWAHDQETCNRYINIVEETLFVDKPADVFDEKTMKRTVSFWGASGGDYEAFNRKVTLLDWEDTKVNYPAAVINKLEGLRTVSTPVVGGRIILFHGVPGTGKTSLIRAIAHQWTDWCHTSYVMDPEQFLGGAGAMLKVITWNFEQYIKEGVKKEDAYHLLVLEDADELITRDAKSKTGQALSRLLNIADGLLGQSTNLLICITTNVDMAEMHPAISRPGRCLVNVEFAPFSREEAVTWVETTHPETSINVLNEGDMKNKKEFTLAELYQAVSTVKQINLPRTETVYGQYL